MGSSPATDYRVEHVVHRAVPKMRIRDHVLYRAKQGDQVSRKRICMSFRDRFKQLYQSDPGMIEFADLTIIPLPPEREGAVD